MKLEPPSQAEGGCIIRDKYASVLGEGSKGRTSDNVRQVRILFEIFLPRVQISIELFSSF